MFRYVYELVAAQKWVLMKINKYLAHPRRRRPTQRQLFCI